MKKIFHILTAALLVAGALLTTACTNDDIATDDNAAKTVSFTATLAPKGGASRDQSQACSSFGEAQPALAEGKDGATTRVITTSKDANNKEVLNVAWAEGEEIGVYYEKTNGKHAMVEATVTAVDGETGVATISATLTDAKDGGTANFIYPYSLREISGTNRGIKRSIILSDQRGILTYSGSGPDNSISTNFDAAYATGTIAVNDNVASVSGMVTMENQCCICKFDLSVLGTPAIVNFYDVSIAFEQGDTYILKGIQQKNLKEVYAAMFPVDNATATITVTGYQGNRENEVYRGETTIQNVTLAAGKFYRNVPVTLMPKPARSLTLSPSDTEVTLQYGDMLTGTGGENTRLKIAAGATVFLLDVTNTGITQNADIPGIECLGDATIILAGTNRVTGRVYAAGIFVPAGKTLTIMGNGSLNATGGSRGAGIGGSEDVSCGNIVIMGGTVTATSTGRCAGIGSGHATVANITCGDITISGGTVTATGGAFAAGIGSGDNDTGTNTCGAISITGGTVTATGGNDAAGIGSGHANQASNNCGAITISGGNVTATGGEYAAGIGSGNGNHNQGNPYVSVCGAISITGGMVTATSGDRAAGIGSGCNGSFASISIGSGITRVTATRNNNYWNVPIGKGRDDQGSGAVTFDGQTLTDDQTKGTENATYGGINVAVSAYGTEGLTWTLTPAP